MFNEVYRCSDYGFVNVRNVGGTSQDDNKKYKNSWIQHYKKLVHEQKEVPQDQDYTCSVVECSSLGTHGAHVVFDNDDGLYLVPMCAHHNPAKGCLKDGRTFEAQHGYRSLGAVYAVKLYDLVD